MADRGNAIIVPQFAGQLMPALPIVPHIAGYARRAALRQVEAMQVPGRVVRDGG